VQELTFVPLYGDMQIAPYQCITQMPNYDPGKWPCCESSHPSPQSNVLPSLSSIRHDHMEFISELAKVNNEVSGVMVLEVMRGHKVWVCVFVFVLCWVGGCVCV
jgi:hypothetical protein